MWILGNPAAYADRPWAGNYRAYLEAFNGYLTGLGQNPTVAGGTLKLRLVDWGLTERQYPQLAKDQIHPTAAGAAFLGEDIKAKIKTCT